MNRITKITAATSAPAACGNTGAVSAAPLVGAAPTSVCPDCDGFGEVEMLALDATRPAIVLCDCCEGSGEVPATCHRCEGVLVSGYCADCDENLSEPESVAVAFARLFNPPILEAGVIELPDGSSRVEF